MEDSPDDWAGVLEEVGSPGVLSEEVGSVDVLSEVVLSEEVPISEVLLCELSDESEGRFDVTEEPALSDEFVSSLFSITAKTIIQIPKIRTAIMT